MVRALVRLLYGTTLMQGSYAEALEHYKTASTLAPRTLVHRVEYGRTLHKMGQVQNATHELHRALALDVEDLNGHLQQFSSVSAAGIEYFGVHHITRV
ncbi:uncharacterized protein HaLaN_31817 [Haematococcus lacustris]|uniref:Uncharacterized protein n=1 Tax=Haematococcus lacustris TaxID=44745 RepID=A0A6A0AIK3_HAELA|nr:uncharacterized protein HaLaN_31817 [Haematococcus lacustris]